MQDRADSFQPLVLGLRCNNTKHIYKYRAINKESRTFQSKLPGVLPRGSHGAILLRGSYDGTEKD